MNSHKWGCWNSLSVPTGFYVSEQSSWKGGKKRQFCHRVQCWSSDLSEVSAKSWTSPFWRGWKCRIWTNMILMEKGGRCSSHMIRHSWRLGEFYGIISTELPSGPGAEEETADQFIKLQSGKFLLVSKLRFWLSAELGKAYTDVLITCLVFWRLLSAASLSLLQPAVGRASWLLHPALCVSCCFPMVVAPWALGRYKPNLWDCRRLRTLLLANFSPDLKSGRTP